MARTTVARADVVAIVGLPGVGGIHRQARIIDDVVRFGVEPERVLPIVNRGPRAPRLRADIARTLAGALSAFRGEAVDVASPLFIADRRRLDEVHRDGVPLPRPIVEPVGAAVNALLERVVPRRVVAEPVPVAPGTLGSWSPDPDGRG